ncbi:hypothetical protein MPNT_210001 [Candidatus Methylacidithermus pantelleriae]|uniref:Uncharacterized protein n=1 Tax=Candidatus Methylacidithermus pantelleriae TaxID=2744239 RepID=A0A8J2FNN5_9BACT|nr:hypothetical protein MPNT_210001 [Candidatus Methylacidithermus pantelleriae]
MTELPMCPFEARLTPRPEEVLRPDGDGALYRGVEESFFAKCGLAFHQRNVSDPSCRGLA